MCTFIVVICMKRDKVSQVYFNDGLFLCLGHFVRWNIMFHRLCDAIVVDALSQ